MTAVSIPPSKRVYVGWLQPPPNDEVHYYWRTEGKSMLHGLCGRLASPDAVMPNPSAPKCFTCLKVLEVISPHG